MKGKEGGRALDRKGIEERIPHRAPFLFVDRVVIAAGTSDPEAPAATATWRVPAEADFFRGHFPGNPVTPGVILCEHTFQASAVLLAERAREAEGGLRLPVLARIERAKFKRMVRPGEELRTEIRLVDTIGPAFFLETRSSVGSELALEVRCVLQHVDGGGK